jgi:hypothetical protein
MTDWWNDGYELGEIVESCGFGGEMRGSPKWPVYAASNESRLSRSIDLVDQDSKPVAELNDSLCGVGSLKYRTYRRRR